MSDGSRLSCCSSAAATHSSRGICPFDESTSASSGPTIGLTRALRPAAAATAMRHNPANRPPGHAVAMVAKALRVDPPSALTVLVTKYWGAKGVSLTVGFIEKTDVALRKRILEHMNAWGKT